MALVVLVVLVLVVLVLVLVVLVALALAMPVVLFVLPWLLLPSGWGVPPLMPHSVILLTWI
jgi:hypothetical protein